jgi:hypothetical protein
MVYNAIFFDKFEQIKHIMLALFLTAVTLIASNLPVGFEPVAIRDKTQIFIQESVDTPKQAETIRRAAFDMGGGSIRVLVADVNPKTHQIVNKLFNAKITISFREALKNSDELDEKIRKVAQTALSHLRVLASQYHPEAYFGIATEAFRLAKNGKEFVESLDQSCGVPFRLIEQDLEGKLGFLAEVSSSGASEDKTIVIDIGTGSTQITSMREDKTFEVFETKYGRVAMDEMICRNIRNLTSVPTTINPVSEEEVEKAVEFVKKELEKMSDDLRKKIGFENVKIIGTFTPVCRETFWNKESASDFLKSNFLNRRDDDLVNPKATSKAILIYALISGLDIKECTVTGNNGTEGSTQGLLISEEFWTDFKS